MLLTKTTTLLYFILIYTISYSQSGSAEWGIISSDEKKLKECSFDPEAEAIILLDEAAIDHDDDYNMITTRRIRIKILSAKGIEHGDITIPFYALNKFEMITDVEAITYNFDTNEQGIPIPVDKKTIYTTKSNKYYSLVKFAMPALKVGSIIEYRYKSTMESYGGLEYWDFQSNLPTIKSSLMLNIPERLEFTYSIQKSPSLFIITRPKTGGGGIYFEMNNVPALRNEPYMDARRDYIQRVTFQLSGVLHRSGYKEEVKTTWQSAGTDLMTSKSFGKLLDKKVNIEALNANVSKESSVSSKVAAIYNYVRNKFTWNGLNSIYADGFDNLIKTSGGHAAEINLLLINLLSNNGIEVSPMLVSERDHGKIDPNYPFLEKFNKVVAFIKAADGKQFILDATQKYSPPELVPFQLLNTTALLVDKKNSQLVNINSSRKYKNAITINAEINSKGTLNGHAFVKSYDYAKQIRTEHLKENEKALFSRVFEQSQESITIDSVYINNLDDDTTFLEQGVKFNQQLNESGGMVFLNYNLFTGLEENPFLSSIRFTNVNFGFPYQVTADEIIKLPPNAKIDLPENKSIKTPDGSIIVSRNLNFQNGELKVKIDFTQTVTNLPPSSYSGLKDFYKNMVNMLNEPVVIRLSN